MEQPRRPGEWRVPVARSGGAFRWRVPVARSGGAFRWRVPVARSGGAFRHSAYSFLSQVALALNDLIAQEQYT
jgi:hypothetical protein